MNGVENETQPPRTSKKRRLLIAIALVVPALGILLLGGAWQWGWFGGKVTTAGTTVKERVFDLGDGVELTLCWCPPGTLLMGSPASEARRVADEIQHEVTSTRGFWMAKTETTKAQWATLKSDNPSYFKGSSLPVERVAWDEAAAFAAALTELLRQEGKLEAGWEFRLPSEAQWEYACRAGTTTAYFTGDGAGALRRAGWYDGNSGARTSRLGEWLRTLPVVAGWFGSKSGGESKPVGGKAANAFGLHDMHGNVWEWCEDWYGAYGAGKASDPLGPANGPSRVIRGGSWFDGADSCRSASRFGWWPGGRLRYLGFRVCLVPGAAAEPQPQE